MAMNIRMAESSEAKLAGRGRGAAKQRLSDGRREYVVEIKVQLSEHADAVAARGVDRDRRFQADLEIAADPDHARIDGAGGDKTVAEIVGNRRRHLEFDDRD